MEMLRIELSDGDPLDVMGEPHFRELDRVADWLRRIDGLLNAAWTARRISKRGYCISLTQRRKRSNNSERESGEV
jgi:hypothetical protein